MAGAAFGDVGVVVFVAGAVFGDLGVSLFVADAAFGDVGVSFFVAGTVLGEIWVDSRSAKCCNFQYKIRLRNAKSPSMHSSSRTRPFAEVAFRASETHFVLKITRFRASAIYPNFTEYCACHEK